MLHLQFSVYRIRVVCTRLFHFVVGSKNAKEAFGVDECIVHVVINAMKLADGSTHIAEKHNVVHDLTNGHAWVVGEYEIGSEDYDEYGSYLFEEGFEAVEEIALTTNVHLLVGHVLLNLFLFQGFNVLAIKRFDNRHAFKNVQDAL